jgi:hypothetical protein
MKAMRDMMFPLLTAGPDALSRSLEDWRALLFVFQ